MQYIEEEFFSYESAAHYRDYIYRQYPPVTFGTSLKVKRGFNKQTFVVSGHRFNGGDHP
jgi:hypothetical protein